MNIKIALTSIIPIFEIKKHMLSLEYCQQLIQKSLNDVKLPEIPSNLYDPIRYILNLDAKRVRPSLVLMACNLFSEKVDEGIPAAMAIEVFHNFTLIHDDIMDGSDLRRNQPTVHKKWNESIALLSGDAMLIKAYEILFQSNKQLLPLLFPVFNQTALEVCEGQQYDMDFEKMTDVSVQDYLLMIERKTAVLIAASLQMGAICGRADDRDAFLLYEFGKNIGLAFQLQDDLLDVFSDSEVFGKVCGNDIVSNKKTLLIIEALSRAGKPEKEVLNYWMEKKVFDRREKIESIRNIYLSLGIDMIVRQRIEACHQKALKCLGEVSVSADRKEVLINFSNQLMKRKK